MLAILVVAVTTIANLLIAFLVYRKNPKSVTHQLLAALSLITAVWTVTNYLALAPGPEQVRLFWVRAVMFFTTPYGTVILLLSQSFPNSSLEMSRKSKIALLAFNAITALLALSPYMFTKLENLPGGSFSLTPGPAIALFGIGFMGFMTVGFIKLVKKYRKSQGLLRSQLGLFIWGIIISFTLLSLTNFVAVVVFGSIQLTSLGPPFTLILFGFTAYAIARHKFLDISFIVFRAVSYTLITLILVAVYAIVLLTIPNFLPDQYQDYVTILLGLILVYSYNPLRRIVERLTKNIFYKQPYETDELLEELGETIRSSLSLKYLSEKVLELLTQRMSISWGSLVTKHNDDTYRIRTVGLGHKFELTNNTIHNLISVTKKKVVLFDELDEGPVKMLMREHDLSAIVPLRVKRARQGLLLLGQKSSGEIYSGQDLDVLDIFAPQMSVAVQNALSYEEISNFNVTLREEIKAATQKLRDANKDLRKLNKLKDDFVFVATHELKNPVTALKGYLSMIRDGMFGKVPSKLADPFEQMQSSSQQLVTLINDLLNIARSEAGTVTLDIDRVDMCSVVDQIITNVQVLADQKKISLEHVCSKQHEVKADRNKMMEIINNLLSNAIKYSDKGTITVTHEVDGKMLVTKVSDQGVGIPDDQKDKIFTRFYRVEEEAAKGIPGTGLGLYIVKDLIEKMGGKIWFESQRDKGTTFFFSLPKA